MKFDLHMHTTRHSPDSFMGPFVMLRRAREVGLHGIVITEHDWLWTEDELDELRAAAPGFLVLAGVEVSTRTSPGQSGSSTYVPSAESSAPAWCAFHQASSVGWVWKALT